jgi:hypothetical protein
LIVDFVPLKGNPKATFDLEYDITLIPYWDLEVGDSKNCSVMILRDNVFRTFDEAYLNTNFLSAWGEVIRA